jgi:hypothetical protein
MELRKAYSIQTVTQDPDTQNYIVLKVYPRRAYNLLEHSRDALVAQKNAYSKSLSATNGQVIYRTERGFNDKNIAADELQLPDYTEAINLIEEALTIIENIQLQVVNL